VGFEGLLLLRQRHRHRQRDRRLPRAGRAAPGLHLHAERHPQRAHAGGRWQRGQHALRRALQGLVPGVEETGRATPARGERRPPGHGRVAAAA
jgi:hypothetical protein